MAAQKTATPRLELAIAVTLKATVLAAAVAVAVVAAAVAAAAQANAMWSVETADQQGGQAHRLQRCKARSP
jgi:Spy/CpxP family protein refolding chaperone